MSDGYTDPELDLANLHGTTKYGEDPAYEERNVKRVCRYPGCDTVLTNGRAQCCEKHKYQWRWVCSKVRKLLALAAERRPAHDHDHDHDDPPYIQDPAL